jgi:dihydrofolate reductase
MLVTLDGFIAAPDGNLDAFDVDDEMMRFANEVFRSVGGIVFGRTAYQGFVSYWDALDPTDPSVRKVEAEFAGIFTAMPRVVVSRTLEEVGDNAILAGGDLGTEISNVKRQPGEDLLLIGGPELVSALLPLGLIDRYRILVCPVVLGEGIALFKDVRDPVRLKLVDTTVFGSGAVMLDYEAAEA